MGQGIFTVTSTTQILVDSRHFTEDRTAAEMLSQEIFEQSALQVPVDSTTDLSKESIVLARLTDPEVRPLLPSDVSVKDLGTQGYVISAQPARNVVAAETGQGLFYGVQTLRQLLRPKDSQLVCPVLSVRDWPSMTWRGVHDDISRGPVPTLDYMKKQVRTLAAYKINLFALYMEHIFEFQSQPLVAPQEAALTPSQIRELIEYAQKYYVTILPEQQTFGHLHHVLKYEIYSDIAETPHGHVLTPTNEKTYDFIEALYGELVPLFPGPFLHIGADETFELGRGQTKARADQVGLGRVYLEHLQKVNSILKPYHKQLMFWGDIAVKYPQLLGILPKDMIAVPWDYDAKPSYDSILKPYKDAGLHIVVAPGVSNWKAIWPDFPVAFVNIRNFVRDGQKFGAIGMLNTTWDDDGETLFDMTWPGLVFGAAAGWQPGESSIETFKASYDWAFYRNQSSTFTDAISELNRVHGAITTTGRQEGAMDDLFWADPFTLAGSSQLQQVLPAARDIRLSAEHALELLYRNRTAARANADTIDDIIFAAWRLDALGMKMQFTAELNHFYWDAYQNQGDAERVGRDLEEITSMNARLEDLRDATTHLRSLYSQAWQQENRIYWLNNVLVRYDTAASELQGKIVALRDVWYEYGTRRTLPPPQQLGFYLQPKP